MSNSTGTRKPRDVQTRVNESLTVQDQLYIADLKVFSGDSIAEAGLAGPNVNNSPNTPAGNYLARGGDSMIGPLALGPPLDFRIEVDTANTIVISSLGENPQYSSNLQLDDFQTNSSVLDIIEGAAFDGQMLILRTFAPTSEYTISQATLANGGNIQTGADEDIALGDLQTMVLVFDESLIVHANTGGTWRVISVSDPTSGLAAYPIQWPKASLTPPASSSFTVDLSLETGNANQVLFPAGDISLQLIGDPSVAVGQEIHILFIQDGVGGRSLASVDSTIKNGANMDILLDKAADAKTMFKLVTLDGGVSYHAILVDLTSLSGGYTTIQDEGSAVTQRATMNFIGPNVTVVDNPGSSRTDITISTGSGALSTLTIDITKSWLGFGIFDLDYIESNAPLNVGSGFIRMGTGEEIRMRNPTNTDDLVFTSGVDAVGNQALLFQIASGDQLTISAFDLDVVDNDIIRTGDITPGAGAHQVGDQFDFYNQMHSQYFVPEGAAVITNRYGLSKNGNQLYVNFNDIDADAGFGIREEGIQQFLFSKLFGTVYEFFIGSDPFTSGEEYRIQMGENSNSSARIYFIEGIGNDLILDRAGGSIDQGVQIRVNGLSSARFLSQEIKIFQPLNVNAKDLFNVVDIKSNGGGGATTGTIGEVITNDGGFDYWMRSRLSWESDPDTFIQFSASGIAIASDDGFSAASVDSHLYATTGSGTNMSFFPNSTLALTIQDNAIVHQSGINLFLNDSFVDFGVISTPSTPSNDHGIMYAKNVGSSSTPFWLDDNGVETNMILGSGGGGTTTAGVSVVKTFSLPAVNNSTTLVDDAELKFNALAATVYYIKFNVVAFSTNSADIKYGIKIPSGATYRIAFGAGFGTDFSASTGTSGGQTVAYSTSTGDAGQHQFVVKVEMGGSAGEVALQFAQNNADASTTTLQRGSLMEVFQEGSSGGGSGDLSFIDYNLGVSVPAKFWRTDTDKIFIGNNNGTKNIGITLGNVEPAGFTFTYVVKASDFPTSLPGMSLSDFRFCSSLQYLVGDATTQIMRAKTFVNGLESGSQSTNGTGAGLFGMMGKSDMNIDINVGDNIQLKIWSDAGVAVTLEKFAVFIFPRSIDITVHSIASIFPDDFTDDLVAADPAGFASVDFEDMAPFDEDYVINGRFNGSFTNLYPDRVIHANFGDNLFLAPGSTSVFTRTVDSSTDDLIVPGLKGMANIKIVTLG